MSNINNSLNPSPLRRVDTTNPETTSHQVAQSEHLPKKPFEFQLLGNKLTKELRLENRAMIFGKDRISPPPENLEFDGEIIKSSNPFEPGDIPVNGVLKLKGVEIGTLTQTKGKLYHLRYQDGAEFKGEIDKKTFLPQNGILTYGSSSERASAFDGNYRNGHPAQGKLYLKSGVAIQAEFIHSLALAPGQNFLGSQAKDEKWIQNFKGSVDLEGKIKGTKTDQENNFTEIGEFNEDLQLVKGERALKRNSSSISTFGEYDGHSKCTKLDSLVIEDQTSSHTFKKMGDAWHYRINNQQDALISTAQNSRIQKLLEQLQSHKLDADIAGVDKKTINSAAEFKEYLITSSDTAKANPGQSKVEAVSIPGHVFIVRSKEGKVQVLDNGALSNANGPLKEYFLGFKEALVTLKEKSQEAANMLRYVKAEVNPSMKFRLQDNAGDITIPVDPALFVCRDLAMMVASKLKADPASIPMEFAKGSNKVTLDPNTIKSIPALSSQNLGSHHSLEHVSENGAGTIELPPPSFPSMQCLEEEDHGEPLDPSGLDAVIKVDHEIGPDVPQDKL